MVSNVLYSNRVTPPVPIPFYRILLYKDIATGGIARLLYREMVSNILYSNRVSPPIPILFYRILLYKGIATVGITRLLYR